MDWLLGQETGAHETHYCPVCRTARGFDLRLMVDVGACLTCGVVVWVGLPR